MEVPADLIRIAKVVGENEDGMTLFVPKDEEGTFTVEDGDTFLTLMFIRKDEEEEGMRIWLPWETEL